MKKWWSVRKQYRSVISQSINSGKYMEVVMKNLRCVLVLTLALALGMMPLLAQAATVAAGSTTYSYAVLRDDSTGTGTPTAEIYIMQTK
ncbi:MAG: hypothetical protein AAB110_09335, partial [Candidatus Desantisbacteria bacterium]